MTVSIGSNNKLNSIAGVAKVLQLTNSEKISLANKVLPSNILVRDDAGVLYMSDGVHPISALSPVVPTKISDLTNDSGFISAHPAVTTTTDTTSTATATHGGSFDVVDGVTRDSFGHVTKINVKTVTLPADNNTDTLVNQNVSSANNTYPILLTPTANASANQGAKTAIFASGVKVNPKTNTVSATAFTGNLTGNVTGNVSGSSGSCTGNAATATNATNNANGNTLSDSIIKGLSVSGKTITYTMLDDTTGTITTQDTNTDTKVTQSVSTDDKTFPVLLCNNEDATTNVGAAGAKFATGVKVNPSTNTISATFAGDLTGNVTGNVSGSSGSCTGNAATATQFSSNAAVTLTGDVTGTVSSKKGWSVATTLANSGVTQGTYGPSANVTGNNGTTLSVPEITVDSKGRITSIVNRTYTSVNTNTDTLVTQNVSSTDASYPILLTPTSNATTNQGAKTAIFASGVKVNPSSGTIAATAFSGPLTGNVTGNCSGTAANVTGTVAIGNGGTGATTRINAFKNLTNEIVGEAAQYFITCTANWDKAGVSSIAQAKKVLGIDGVANVDASKAISGITRSGTTFTYTCLDGSTGTFTQQDNNTTYKNMTAATASAAGKAGLVPAPGAGKQTSFLRGDGTWVVPTNTTYSLMSASEATTGTATTARSISAKVLNDKIDEKISALVASAPETLDTLNELASALGNDPNFATTVANQIGTKANASDLNNYLRLTGGTITNNINKVGVNCSWKDGRTNAIVKTDATSNPSSNQYVPCISAKSYQGSWELGTYTNNDYYLTYITDADFDAGTNKAATQYKFCSNGTLIATKFQGALVGNADTATKATNNASGNELSNSIIKDLSVSGKVITYTKLDGTTGTITTQDTNTWTAFKGATSSANGTAGYVPAPTKGNQNKFFRADGTWATPTNTTYSFTNSAPTLAWGTTSTIGTVGGVDLTVTMPANPNTDTHWTTTLYAGAKDAKSNAVTTNGNAYIKLFDNSAIRSQLNIKGSGATTVTTDANGVITISSTDNNTTYSVATTSANGLMSKDDKTKLDGLSNYTLPTASSTLGGVKTTSTVTSTSGLTACPIISGVPYYKDTNTIYSAMSAAEATTGTATTSRSISAKVLHDKISSMIPDNVAAITSAEITELVSQKLSPTPTRDGAMWMDSNYTMFVNEYNRG